MWLLIHAEIKLIHNSKLGPREPHTLAKETRNFYNQKGKREKIWQSLVQDRTNSSALAMELLQSCTNLSLSEFCTHHTKNLIHYYMFLMFLLLSTRYSKGSKRSIYGKYDSFGPR